MNSLYKIIITLLSFILSILCLSAQSGDKVNKFLYDGFSGGMTMHSGFIFGGESVIYNQTGVLLGKQVIDGFPFGVGGCIRIHFGKHLRIGAEGYNSTLNYAKTGSFLSLGWGGLLVDCHWQLKKIFPFLGGTIGGGKVKNLCLIDDYKYDFLEDNRSSYQKYPVMLLVPFVGFEYAITQKIHFVLKVDYVFNIGKYHPDLALGPRCYIGILFRRGYSDNN